LLRSAHRWLGMATWTAQSRGKAPRIRRLMQTVLAQPHVELFARQPEHLGGVGLVLSRLLERALDSRALQQPEIGRLDRGSREGMRGLLRRRLRLALRGGEGEVLAGDEPTFAEDRGPFEGVAKLAHVARPVIVEESRTGFARDARRRSPQRLGDLREK